MNKPKIDAGHYPATIDKCREDAPGQSCESCQATMQECFYNQMAARNGAGSA